MDVKRLEDLRKMAIFSSLSSDELKELAQVFSEKAYLDGDRIFSETELGDAMYIIRSGIVKISRSKDGKEEELASFGPGDFLGEVGLFRDVLRTATAVAIKQTIVFVVPRGGFNKFILEKPQIGVKILYYMVGEMAKRLRMKNREGEGIAF